MGWLATISGVVFAGLAGFLVLTINDAMRAKLRIRRRLQPVTDLLDAEGPAPVVAALPAARTKSDNYIVERLDAWFPLAGGVRTGMIVLGTTLLVWIVLAPAMVFVGVPTIFAIPVSIVAAIVFGWNVGTAVEDRKREAFNNQLVTVVEDFQRLVRFGTSSLRALRSVAANAEEPLAPSLKDILRETDFGVPLEQAMAREAHRIRMGEMAMLAAIISTQTGTGGSLSEAVGNLGDLLRERLDSNMRLKAATAESKVTLIVLALVPVLGVTVQAFLQPDIVTSLLNEARHLLGIGVGLIASGLFVSWLMMRGAQR